MSPSCSTPVRSSVLSPYAPPHTPVHHAGSGARVLHPPGGWRQTGARGFGGRAGAAAIQLPCCTRAPCPPRSFAGRGCPPTHCPPPLPTPLCCTRAAGAGGRSLPAGARHPEQGSRARWHGPGEGAQRSARTHARTHALPRLASPRPVAACAHPVHAHTRAHPTPPPLHPSSHPPHPRASRCSSG